MTIDKKLIPTLRFPQFSGEWEVKRLGDVLTFGSGRDYKHLGVGDIPVYGTGGVMTFVDDYLYDGDSIGIGRKGTINKPVFLSGKFWSVDTLFYTHSFINLDVLFAYNYFLKVNWLKYNEASGVPSLSKSTLQTIKISLPTTLPEQEKIASFLSSIDRKVELLKAKKEQLEQYKKGMMQQLFAQTIRFKDQNGNQFPEWQEKRLGEIMKEFKSKQLSDGVIPILSSSKRGLMTQLEYYGGVNRITNREGVYYNVLPENYITYRSRSDDGVFSFNLNTLGYTGLVSTYYPVFSFNTECNYYIELILNNRYSNRISVLSVGTSQRVLSMTDLRNLKINLPSLPEQQKTADFLSAIDRKIEGVGQQMAQTELFKKAMLQQLFV